MSSQRGIYIPYIPPPFFFLHQKERWVLGGGCGLRARQPWRAICIYRTAARERGEERNEMGAREGGRGTFCVAVPSCCQRDAIPEAPFSRGPRRIRRLMRQLGRGVCAGAFETTQTHLERRAIHPIH